MKNKYESTVEKIDKHIRENAWFDFHVWRYDGRRFVISGSTDLMYYHKLEITFTKVFFASIFFEGWHANTSEPVIGLPDKELTKELNMKFEIEEGYQIFVLKTEDFQNDIYVAAKEIDFNTDTVYYYRRQNLKENERVADFVTEGET